ncbi:DNA polymerase III subunit beta [Ochrobactrum sp. 30A/1000/2015]|nr:DNA polymerase III subunit beta [Ochrobactrum sp. 30A/1000/2015]PJT40192.1 DNA polymerase III subunit beta [Ochrobactrum sp. 27A/999/2015]PJT45326.1 DNA polymerase III subunit beta [Ochrobactrum sp. 23A/997/2015]
MLRGQAGGFGVTAVSFAIERGALLPALAAVNRAVEKRNTIPILGNLLLKVEDGHLCVTGTNLDIEVQAVAKKEGLPNIAPFTVQSGLLHDAVKKFADGSKVEFEGDQTHVNIKSGRSRFRLQVLPASDFPEMAGDDFTHEFSIAGSTLARVLATVGFAISTEETRYYLNGVLMHRDGEHLAFVATDGHRLALMKLDAPAGSDGVPGIIIPRRTVALLQHFAEGDEDIVLKLSERKMRIVLPDGTTITSKLIDGTYPDYQRVIPTSNDKSYTVDRTGLADAINRVSTVSSERGRAVKFSFGQSELKMEVNNPDSGQAEDSIVVNDGHEDEVTIGFNHKYCLDVLGAVSAKEMRFELSDPGAPCKVSPVGAEDGDVPPLFVIMPMRV